MARVLEGRVEAAGLKIAIVASRFNSLIVDQLVAGATEAFYARGGNETDLVLARVPGAFELPLIAKKLLQTGQFDGVVALGAVIRGATSHYDLVCEAAAEGVAQLSLESGCPVLFGVVTTDTVEQAMERAGTHAGNKGADAMLGAIEMIQLSRSIDQMRRDEMKGAVGL